MKDAVRIERRIEEVRKELADLQFYGDASKGQSQTARLEGELKALLWAASI